MALYLVVHGAKREEEAEAGRVSPPSRLEELARRSLESEDSPEGDRAPRWLKTWSPDLHDDRIFSLWEAADAAAVRDALESFGFLDDRDVEPLRVREWGPADVIAAGE